MNQTSPDCPYCDRAFANDRLLTLHKGYEHPDELTDSERTDFETAYEAEEEALRIYRLKALLVVVLLYFGYLFAYRIVG